VSCRLFLGSAKREERCRIPCTNNVTPRVSSIGTAVEEVLDVEAVAVSGCSEPRCNCRFHKQPSWGDFPDNVGAARLRATFAVTGGRIMLGDV
jgi:hypothetical protein